MLSIKNVFTHLLHNNNNKNKNNNKLLNKYKYNVRNINFRCVLVYDIVRQNVDFSFQCNPKTREEDHSCETDLYHC